MKFKKIVVKIWTWMQKGGSNRVKSLSDNESEPDRDV